MNAKPENKRREKMIGVMVTKDTEAALRIAAARRGLTLSTLANEIIESFVKATPPAAPRADNGGAA